MKKYHLILFFTVLAFSAYAQTYEIESYEMSSRAVEALIGPNDVISKNDTLKKKS